MKQTSALEVGIPVVDLDRMIDFYCDVMSCQELRRAEVPAALSRGLTTGDRGYLNVWLQTPHGEVIKLMSPATPPTLTPAPTALIESTGVRYLTFYCEDIEQVLLLAQERGARLRSDRALLDGQIGVKLCFFEDPEGNVLELVEPV